MNDRVTVTTTDGVADVRLNRADKRNALDPAMFAALIETSASLATDAALRAVVVSGEGESFCAGLDFASFQAMAGDDGGIGADDGAEQVDAGLIGRVDGRITHGAQQSVWGWRELGVPVIMAVHGHALGGGLQLALGGDLRIVHPDAQMSVLEIRWGLIPDMCATVLLPPLVGPDKAKELYWTGAMVNGREAVEMGLATRLSDDPRASALALAHDIAARSPEAIRRGKSLIDEVDGLSVAEAFASERAHMGALIGSPHQVEAVSAYFEKRAPVFD